MTINERVGNNIRKYRIAHHYTLKDLSALVHKSCSTLSKYEKEFFPSVLKHWKNLGMFSTFPLRISCLHRPRGNQMCTAKVSSKNITCTIMMAEENEL